MAGTLKHRKVSAVADGGDSTKVRSLSDWNDSLVMAGGSLGNIPVRSSASDGWELINHGPVNLTNNTGATLSAGDVVAIDSNSNTIVVDTDTSLRIFVVAQESIANTVSGRFGRVGPMTVKVTGSVTALNYAVKAPSATSKSLKDSGVAITSPAPTGTLGFFITSGSGTVTAYMFGYTSTGAALGQNIFTGRQEWKKGADIASASSITIGTDGNYFVLTGTTPITAISAASAGTVIMFRTASALLFTNSGSLVMSANANYVTRADETLVFISDGGGTWRQTGASSSVRAEDAVAADIVVANTTTQTDIYSFTVIGSKLGTKNKLRLTITAKVTDTDATVQTRTYTLRFKYGATTLITSDAIPTTAITAECVPALGTIGSNKMNRIVFELDADNATSAQIGQFVSQHFKEILTPPITLTTVRDTLFDRGVAAEDSSANKTLAVTVQWSHAHPNTSFTMEKAILELIII